MKDKLKGVLIAMAARRGARRRRGRDRRRGAAATTTHRQGDHRAARSTGPAPARSTRPAAARSPSTEVGDEEGAYEVEVTRADGSQVDVHLDRDFNVVGDQATATAARTRDG